MNIHINKCSATHNKHRHVLKQQAASTSLNHCIPIFKEWKFLLDFKTWLGHVPSIIQGSVGAKTARR